MPSHAVPNHAGPHRAMPCHVQEKVGLRGATLSYSKYILVLRIPDMSGSVTYGGQSVDTGVATVTQGVATVAGTGVTGYDASDLPVLVAGDANNPSRKVSPEGPITLLAAPTVTGGNPLASNTDGNVVFSQQARGILVRNLTAVDVYLEPDATASTGSWPVLAGESVYLGWLVTTLHIYPSGGTVSVNVAGGLFVRGGA
jgi:hypothetical protein